MLYFQKQDFFQISSDRLSDHIERKSVSKIIKNKKLGFEIKTEI